MKSTASRVITGLVVLSVVSLGAWRYVERPRRIAAAVLIDISESAYDRCEAAVGIVDSLMRRAERGAGGTITLFRTGDRRTSNEPRRYKVIELSRRVIRVLEGPEAAEARAATEHGAILAEVRTECKKQPVTHVSPILLGIRRAAEYIRAFGNGSTDLELIVQTDLEENVDAALTSALRKRGPVDSLPVAIDNGIVRVTFCGGAATKGTQLADDGSTRQVTGARVVADLDRVQSLWRSEFSNLALITFVPFCPTVSSASPQPAPSRTE